MIDSTQSSGAVESWNELPLEILQAIDSYLDESSHQCLLEICKSWRQMLLIGRRRQQGNDLCKMLNFNDLVILKSKSETALEGKQRISEQLAVLSRRIVLGKEAASREVLSHVLQPCRRRGWLEAPWCHLPRIAADMRSDLEYLPSMFTTLHLGSDICHGGVRGQRCIDIQDDYWSSTFEAVMSLRERLSYADPEHMDEYSGLLSSMGSLIQLHLSPSQEDSFTVEEYKEVEGICKEGQKWRCKWDEAVCLFAQVGELDRAESLALCVPPSPRRSEVLQFVEEGWKLAGESGNARRVARILALHPTAS